jgi:hypothetical protein
MTKASKEVELNSAVVKLVLEDRKSATAALLLTLS